MTRKHQEQQQIHALLERKSLGLAFSNGFERQFQRDYARKYRDHMRAALLIASIIFLLTLAFDRYFLLDWHATWFIRVSLTAPALLLLIVIAFTPGFSYISQLVMSLSALLFSLAVIAIAYFLSEPYKNMYYDMIVLIEIYAFSLARIRFMNACILAGIIFLLFNIVLYWDPVIHLDLLVVHNFLFLSAALFALLNNYFMERSARQSFLQAQLLRYEKQDLQADNVQLQNLASRDSLTNIANRRAFNIMIEDEWRRAQRQQYPLALLMIDIDYFKEFNDNYGHQRGDDCLQQIADILRDYTRRPGDLAARYGGDEFIILLSGTHTDEAEMIAGKIDTAVHELAITNQFSKSSNIVTLTIGIASFIPTQEQQPITLLQQADQALYQGKLRGRDCITVYKTQQDQDASVVAT